VKIKRQGYSIYVHDLGSTRGSWLGRAAVYTGATVEWARPRMLRVGATVLSLDLPEAIRRAAPGAQTSAPMTPPPRNRVKAGLDSAATPLSPPVSQRASAPPSQPPPPGIDAVPFSAQPTRKLTAFEMASATPAPAPYAPSTSTTSAGSSGARPRGSPSRKAWKKTGPTIGKASGLLLLALAGLVILGGLFVVFSLLE
jgi:hypothetical protein